MKTLSEKAAWVIIILCVVVGAVCAILIAFDFNKQNYPYQICIDRCYWAVDYKIENDMITIYRPKGEVFQAHKSQITRLKEFE